MKIGIYVALSLRFDYHQYLQTPKGKKNPHTSSFPKPYFYATFIAYIIGLSTTMAVMHYFKAAQPALLYLSPACILSTLITALIRKEWSKVFAFTENQESKEPVAARTKKTNVSKTETPSRTRKQSAKKAE